MSYVIEHGIPMSRGVRELSPMRIVMSEMQPGDSILLKTHDEYVRTRGLVGKSPPGTYAMRKIPGEGWRLWRLPAKVAA